MATDKFKRVKLPKPQGKGDLLWAVYIAYEQCVNARDAVVEGFNANALSNILRRAEDAITKAVQAAPFKNRKYNLISSYIAGVYVWGQLVGYYVSPNRSRRAWHNKSAPSYDRRGNSAAMAYIKRLKPLYGKDARFSVIFAVAMPYATLVSNRYQMDLLKPAVDDFVASARAMKRPYRTSIRCVMRTFNY